MNLGNQIEWALHCVSVLSGIPEGRYLSALTLAEFHGVPKEYLAKALQHLARAGIIEGRLGPKGGYRLARPPAAITFLDVIDAVEGDERAFRCTEIRRNSPGMAPNARSAKPCAVASVMLQAEQAYREVLAQMNFQTLRETVAQDVPENVARQSLRWLLERC